MRRASVATLRVRHLDPDCGLRSVRVKGGKTRDIPLPRAVTQFLQTYVARHLPALTDHITADTPLLETLEQHHDLEAVRAMLGLTRIDTTQTYAQIRPPSSSERWSSTRRRPWVCWTREEENDSHLTRILVPRAPQVS